MKIGFIGLGIMGAPMCSNIVRKHPDRVYVYNRTSEKTLPLVEEGASACATIEELAQKSDVIITMVTNSDDSREVYQKVLPLLDDTKVCIDMSTIDPEVSIEISEEVKNTGAECLDAPVVKSKGAAIAGKLGIYVGGTEEAYERVKPILEYMGENIIRMGGNGKGLVMKICHNALVAQIQNGVNETVTLAEKQGIDVRTFAKAISYGGGQNAYLDLKKEVLDVKDYTPAFSVNNMAKDVDICLRLAKDSGLQLFGQENVQQVYREARKEGHGQDDFCSTIEAVKARSAKQ
jgi:3-hydroxyisobutyrate dehydrogenase